MAKVKATLNNLRISPRKVRLVARAIKGLDAQVALVQLSHIVKKTSDDMEKLLKSAIANAENNFGMDKNNLFVSDIQVGEGPKMKRWLPRAQGRATLILKRTSKIFITLEEKIEGKNRRSKEELENIRKEREKQKEKMMKEFAEQAEKEEKENEAKEVKSPVSKKAAIKKTEKKGQDKGWMDKVFQRKSGA